MDNSLSVDSILTPTTTMKEYSNKVNNDADTDSSSYLDFDGYMKLLVAQMSNQDLNNPMEDSEFISQMASYSMMETISQMNTQSQISYATSMVGKAVTVNDNGSMSTGLVESVIVDDGSYYLLINGSKYDSSKITDVVDTDTFKQLSSYIGQKVEIDDDGKAVSGKITDVIVRDGSGYVVVNGVAYPVDSVTGVGDEDSSTDEDSDDNQDEIVESLAETENNG